MKLLLLALLLLLPAPSGAPLGARVRIESMPAGARVYGQAYAANRPEEDILGVTPCLLPVDTRFSHSFTVVREGYATEKVRLEANAAEGSVLQVSLHPSTLVTQLAHPFIARPYLSGTALLGMILLGVALFTRWQLKWGRLRDRVAEAALETPELLGRVIDGYRVMEKIGEGALAQVYRVVHADYGDEFALKWLKPGERTPQALRRFHRELALGRDLIHPRLVRGY